MKTTPQALYDVNAANPAHHLRYAWTGWPAVGVFERCPSELLDELVGDLQCARLNLLEHRWTPEAVQLILSTSPNVSPVMLAECVKDRLARAIHSSCLNLPFSERLAVRSLGENGLVDVERYVRERASDARCVESGLDQKLKSYTVVNSHVDLAAPMSSADGSYWYNLHIAFVTQRRLRITDVAQLCLLRDACDQVAAQSGYAISSVALMPDHLHIELRGNIEHSPVEIACRFQNHLASVAGNGRLWADKFYVGSFGESNLDVVNQQRESSPSRHVDKLNRTGEPTT